MNSLEDYLKKEPFAKNPKFVAFQNFFNKTYGGQKHKIGKERKKAMFPRDSWNVFHEYMSDGTYTNNAIEGNIFSYCFIKATRKKLHFNSHNDLVNLFTLYLKPMNLIPTAIN